ncbi:MAG: 2-phosphosulfolactate phosphatase, partial [Actinobacteria bacterium]|nr:2-phosphosulfolactate phosphatase [Actinomycetota bacterium]
MINISRRAGLEGAAEASGPTVVIDTFRAFSTTAYLLDAGVSRLVLTDGLDEARRIAASLD